MRSELTVLHQHWRCFEEALSFVQFADANGIWHLTMASGGLPGRRCTILLTFSSVHAPHIYTVCVHLGMLLSQCLTSSLALQTTVWASSIASTSPHIITVFNVACWPLSCKLLLIGAFSHADQKHIPSPTLSFASLGAAWTLRQLRFVLQESMQTLVACRRNFLTMLHELLYASSSASKVDVAIASEHCCL